MNFTRKVLNSQWVRPLLLIVAILVVWDLVIRIFKIPPYLVPTPEAIMRQIAMQWSMLLQESLPTLYATLGGFALSVLIGVPIAMLVAASPVIESYLYPLVVFSQSIPKVAIAPLFVVWFGFGLFPRILVAFLLGFFPVVVSTVMGFKSVEKDLIDLAKSMGSSPVKTFFKISLPHALPSIFSSMKVSITLAVVGAVVGEFVGANSGLGFVLQRANGNFDQPLIFSALVVLSVIGALLFVAIDMLERIAIPWHASHRTRSLGRA
ncbi:MULTISPECIES: ABC transporter permease [Paraburkholderia]|uniref:ABC transporter permease n=1 Tax=Paraburkholderia TaxID=1822464 RepID=UPI0002718BF3|nr:ABC transporter permease [Paraburkholderia hospita]AXF04422.1 ABC transporter permease [Paraburkholderia hospita]EUC11799.1 ABC-type transporter, integral membrane subunit [Burkholderia sp. BT03]SKD07443.1 NitT/TauT family transport system permease protein [Paraburkholderia hospita]